MSQNEQEGRRKSAIADVLSLNHPNVVATDSGAL